MKRCSMVRPILLRRSTWTQPIGPAKLQVSCRYARAALGNRSGSVRSSTTLSRASALTDPSMQSGRQVLQVLPERFDQHARRIVCAVRSAGLYQGMVVFPESQVVADPHAQAEVQVVEFRPGQGCDPDLLLLGYQRSQ